jgi:8-amino-7-oxononanoate synthase
VERYGVGAGASHYICGHFEAHEQLSEALARFCGRERAMLFSTGYMANIALPGTLLGRKDMLYQDRLNHASLIDAGILSRAHTHRFRHCDTEHLSALLERDRGAGRRLISTEGVFSMGGDIAPLPEYVRLAQKHQACLVVDDAHGFGVLGAHGRGTVEHFALDSKQVPLLMATLGKALGVSGAFVAGDAVWIESLEQFARTAIYTTAIPPAQAFAACVALELLADAAPRRKRLKKLIQMFRAEIIEHDFELANSQTPIQPLIVGESERALKLAGILWEQGIWVSAIRPPTVPEGTARLRISLSAAHDESDISRLLDALRAVPSELKVAARQVRS